MSIFDLIDEAKSAREFRNADQEAVKMFEAQKKALQYIKETEGFKEILKFWEREKEAAENRLMTAKDIDNLAEARASYALAKRFIGFITARLQ